MFASFHSKRTSRSFNDKLNTLASGMLICSTVSICSFGGIPSIPGDLLFIAFIFLAILDHKDSYFAVIRLVASLSICVEDVCEKWWRHSMEPG